jgi:5-methylcytosine-specific restriction enzyme A
MLAGLRRLVFGESRPGDSKRSARWPALRREWLKDEPRCRACGSSKHLNVHHKRPFHLFPELELDRGNLVTLCETPSWNCHFKVGHGGKSWSDYVEGVEESAARLAEAVASLKVRRGEP